MNYSDTIPFDHGEENIVKSAINYAFSEIQLKLHEIRKDKVKHEGGGM